MTTLAIARLDDAEGIKFLGSAFAVTRRLALTALHCVRNQQAGNVRCVWVTGETAVTTSASVIDRDEINDAALLQLDRVLPEHLTPVQLTGDFKPGDRFTAPGVLGDIPELSLASISGDIVWPVRLVAREADVIQLWCAQSATLPLVRQPHLGL
jgi:hypothetical protein